MRQSSRINEAERPLAEEEDVSATLQELGYSQVGQATESDEIASMLVKLSGDARPFTRVELMGIGVIGLLDSGAQRTVLGVGAKKIMKALNLKLEPSDVNLKTAAGDDLEVLGSVEIPFTFNGCTKLLNV